VLFFRLESWALGLILLTIIVGATVGGLLIGRAVRHKSEGLREPFSVMQAVLLGFMSLVLAFGLSLAVGRYETRRAATVTEADAIGTAYLRAQTLPEPMRTQSLAAFRPYTDASIEISNSQPGSRQQARAIATSTRLQQQLWRLAGEALDQAPTDGAPRLYVESLNEAFDAQTERVASLSNRVPTAVLVLELIVAAIALASLGLHLATIGRGLTTVLVAAVLITATLLVTFDLDRPTRGLIRVPDAALVQVRNDMNLPPAAPAPTHK
jgi:hypothetical protein